MTLKARLSNLLKGHLNVAHLILLAGLLLTALTTHFAYQAESLSAQYRFQPVDHALAYILFFSGLLATYILFRSLRSNARQNDQIQSSERQLRLLTDTLPVLISYIDTDLRYKFVSRKYVDWLGLNQERIQGRLVSDIVLPVNFEKIEPLLKQALSGVRISKEIELQLANGSRRWTKVEYTADRDSLGAIKGIVGLVSDISAQKKYADRGRMLIELSSTLSASFEVDKTISDFAAWVTPQLCDWCIIDRFESDTLVVSTASREPNHKRALEHLQSAEVRKAYRVACESRATGEAKLLHQPSPEEIFDLTDDHGNEILKSLRALGAQAMMVVPLKANNHTWGTITMFASSDYRSMSNDDLAFASDVARRVALAIDYATLYRETNQANRLKDEFLATLSHELRTPMNVIMGWLELIANGDLDHATFEQAIDTLTRNSHMQLHLIDDLLDISRVVNGKFRLDIQRANLTAIAKTAIESFRPAAAAKSIALNFESDLDDFQINGDPNRLHQILWNLISNAMKFTTENGRIAVKIARLSDSVQLTVEDTGQGIETAFLPYIFDRFRQEHGGSTRNHGGLGIGLSISRYLMEMHGGTIEASSPGRGLGTLIRLDFPIRLIAPVIDIHSQANRVARAEVAQKSVSLDGMRVLLLDDSPDVRVLLSRILTRAGADVRTVDDTKQAEAALKASRPDIFLSDIGLPDEDGFSFMKRWRNLERAAGEEPLPAIALTAYAQDEDIEKASQAGFQKHIAKPVTSTSLLQALSSLHQKRHEPLVENTI